MRSAILFILICRCLAAQQAGIEGTVIDAVTRQPMSGVHILMRPASGSGPASDDAWGAISMRDGHFSIANMPPAVYSLSAQRNGYIHLPPKAPIGRDDDTVTLKPGDQLTDFTIEMTPHAVVAGAVVDEFGDPVQHVEVEALSAVPGSRIGSGIPVRTDERGQFHISLPPGKFYVRATANGRMTMVQREIRSDGLDPPVYGPTYYPGTESKGQATAIQLSPGHEATGIDIRLTRKHTLAISGIVTGMDRATPVSVLVLSTNDRPFSRFVLTAPDGKFTVSGLPPGAYTLLAKMNSPGGTPLQSPSVEVRLDAADQGSVSLPLVQGESLAGTLAIEGAPANMAQANQLAVRLARYSVSGGGFEDDDSAKRAEVDRDGAFRIDQLFPGKFRVRLRSLPENAYVKSVKLDNTDAPDGVLDLSRGVGGANIKITVSLNGGQLEGIISGDSLAFVVLAATADDIDGDNTKLVEPGKRFRYSGLYPGKYRLIAVDGRQFAGYNSIKAFFPKAPEIEIREGDRLTRDVKPIDAENPSDKQ